MQSMSDDAPSEEMVLWAYRMILGREAENQRVVEDQLRLYPNLAALRRSFLGSEEFFKNTLSHLRISLKGDEPVSDIETTGSPDKLARLFAHVDRSWESLGTAQPFWSVITDDGFISERLTAERIAEFYRSGEGEFRNFLAALARAGISLSQKTTCLEYGCGLGRLTQQLARQFPRTIGVDISTAHLELAEKHAGIAGLKGIEWVHLQNLSDLGKLPEVDVIYSLIVLQHNPPPVIEAIIGTFARILKPGGVAYFQVPTYRRGYQFQLDAYLEEWESRDGMEMHVFPQERVFKLFAEAGAVPLSVIEDGCTGQYDERSNTFIFQKR